MLNWETYEKHWKEKSQQNDAEKMELLSQSILMLILWMVLKIEYIYTNL